MAKPMLAKNSGRSTYSWTGPRSRVKVSSKEREFARRSEPSLVSATEVG